MASFAREQGHACKAARHQQPSPARDASPEPRAERAVRRPGLERSATVLAALVLAGAPRTVQQPAAALGWPPARVTSALRDAERHPDVTAPVALRCIAAGTYAIAAWLDRPRHGAARGPRPPRVELPLARRRELG
ncbi:hypothetical protein [Sorangium sp. So ce1182]|uniref:hypothetical protein n=1 Tax=Sorangium sp. So ce1182 TaxID=3133334 RepID=UPI003F63EE5B